MMKYIQRRVGIFILLTLLCATGFVSAQDNNTITVVGSSIVTQVFDAMKAASGVTADITSTVTGTRGGIESLCKGQADVVTANRAISADESNNCVNNNINYTELLIAHNILTFVTPADAAYATCLTSANLTTLFAPSAQGKITNWNQIAPENADTPLTVIVPANDQTTFAAVDQFIEGDGIRADALTEGSDTDVATAVSNTPGSIGVVSLPVATAAGGSVKILQLNTNSTTGCAAPSAENVEQRLYAASDDLFIYVNRASLQKPGLQDLLSFAIGDQSAEIISSLGLTPVSATVYDTNRSALAGEGSTHPFSEATTSFSIPADVAGQVNIAGSANGFNYLNALKTSLTAVYTNLTIDIKTDGQIAGARRLCNGEIDIDIIDGPLTAEQNQNCDANNISTLPINLGNQAVVLVGNAKDSALTCLTSDQLKTALSAPTGDAITNWNQVDSSFADEAITIFAPSSGDDYSDLLMSKIAGTDFPMRADVVSNADPLYRAAATANVEGGLTFMNWEDLQKVLTNNQQNIQLVSVNAGSGCVAPSENTIKDGSYPLTRSTQLLVNNASLTKVQVQSFLWYLASDENYSVLQNQGYMGLGFGDLPALRENLQKAFVDAAVAATQAAEATPEATSEATAEATTEATAEATPSS